MSKFAELTTRQVSELLDDPLTSIIDVRSVDAYNGWALKNEARGGHIKGARSLPEKWTKYIDWIEIVRSKQITPEQKLVIYGYTAKESRSVGRLLVKAGYRDISFYDRLMDEWTSDNELPMEKLERYTQLVYPAWVKSIADGEIPPTHNGGKTIICHAHYRNRKAYLSGHIPGSVDIDTLELESPETWNRRTPAELKAALENLGITNDTTVVLYGKFMNPENNDIFPGSSAGQIAAIRCAFIMMYAGVKDVRVLNGGYQAWKDAGFKIAYDDVAKKSVKDFGVQIPANPELAVDIQEARDMLLSDNAELVSVRSWPEYIGKVSGYNYIYKKGRIPGAIFGNCGSDAYHMENYRNLDHTMRESQEVRKIWEDAGITPDKHLAFYCGTGWRGSEAFFNAWLMGYPKVSVFDGGWFEWSNDDNNPYEIGVPEQAVSTIIQ